MSVGDATMVGDTGDFGSGENGESGTALACKRKIKRFRGLINQNDGT